MKVDLKFLFFLFISFSCGEKANSNWPSSISSVNDMFKTFSHEIPVLGEVYINDSIQLMKPKDIKIVHDLMFINDNYDGDLFSVYDMKNKKFISRFLRKGKGPNEYIGGFSLSITPFIGDSLMVLNVLNNTLLIFSLEKARKGADIPDRHIRLVPGNKEEINEICYLFEDVFLTSGLYSKGRFHVYSLQGEDIGFFGKYPTIKFGGEYNNFHLGDWFGSNMNFVFNFEKQKFACTSQSSYTQFSYKKGDGLRIKTDLNIQWIVREFFSASYNHGRAYVTAIDTKTNMIGAGYLAATKKHVLFPFSSYPHSSIHEEGLEDWFGYIFVMDWNGNPIARLKLDKRIKFPLEIDETGRYVYSIHTDLDKTGMRQIVRYDIGFLNDL